MTRALLLGREPPLNLGYEYVTEAPFEAVVIGSLSLSELLQFRSQPVLEALAQGKSVYLYAGLAGSTEKPGTVRQFDSRPAGAEKLGRALYRWRPEEAGYR